MTDARSIDYLNILLIGLSCVAAHLWPYHLLIVSYAVLGPAHYLTQISWLHDRRYFANLRYIASAFVVLILLSIFSFNAGMPKICLSLALGLAAASVIPKERKAWRATAILAGCLLAGIALRWKAAAILITMILPTVLHVFVFTVCFMWAGALKTGNKSAYLAFYSLLFAAATFLFPAHDAYTPSLSGLAFFKPVVLWLQSLLPFSKTTERGLFGFLSFAYTYHYLNWFSKVEIIRWHLIPRQRMITIIIIYVMAISLYAYDYVTGFVLLLFLSQLHVVMEFPLNIRTFMTLASRSKTT